MDAPRADERPYPGAPEPIVRALRGTPPTVQQWEAISHPLSPGVVIAGAGSGKTSVMAARVVYLTLVRQGLVEADHPGALPSEILCLTFTNKAAEELTERVRRATEGLRLPEGEEATVLTYHAFAARLLDDYGLRMGLERGPMLMTEAHKWQLAVSLFAERQFEHLEVRTQDYVVGLVLTLADQCANHLVDPAEVVRYSAELADRAEVRTSNDTRVRETALRRAELAQLVAAYQARKRELEVIDYGDQIVLAHRLVAERPEVAEEFRSRFPVVLLDEYQDTNVAQAELLRLLCGRGYPVFAVGDPDQNIYAWRGASLRNILRFAADFGPQGAEAAQRPLYVNFRSGSRILAAANRVIGEVPPERRAPDKVLRHYPPLGEARVAAFVAEDENAEALQIASMIREEADRRPRTADGEPAWQDFAVLCRKRRLFPALARILPQEDVPIEVVDLGGLLRLPEIVDVVAWLRLLADPSRNIALARILQGPRWRIGYRDLAVLARWSADENRRLRGAIAAEDDMPGDVAFALAEALEHLGDPRLADLSDDSRGRLAEFWETFTALREAARGPLPDLVAEIAERSGLMRELEASASPAAESARRNLLNFIEHIAAFSPMEGEASLATLVAYLDVAEETEDPDLEPLQLSERNSVKLLTVHKAKGLEWPVVFVPGMAEGRRSAIFPDVGRQPDPATRPETLPFELRGDADTLPAYEGNIKAFKKELKDRALEEERRLCYVALTRAQQLLVVSSAYWYEGPKDPFEPSVFFEEVAGEPECEILFRAECPPESPLLEALRERVSEWPLLARPDDRDALFPEGWHEAALAAARDRGMPERRAAELGAGAVDEFRTVLAADRERATLIEARALERRPEPLPASLSVSSVLSYVRCPKLFYWSEVRPLPRRPNPNARLGSEIHRWIELESRGQATLLEVDDLPDLSTEERLGEPRKAQALREAFKRSRFYGRTPLFTERAFVLYLDGMVVGGRIDAVFGDPEGPWEVVDYKTGRVPPGDDPLAGFQLDLYALAATEVWGKRPEDVTLTYFYLAEEKEVTRRAGDPAETRKRVGEALSRMASRQFQPTPGEYCRWCDFLSFCEAGRSHLGV
ncbi:MAG TPA: ATP-dependent DNA helicase [Actinomycetota bacterium]|nr:ATP-dependent DNA helicase [Actinomycetota bacterium]